MTLPVVLNVKTDFGAAGDGSADDTAEIQACFDAAFGSSASPNGLNWQLNKAVYFPVGEYRITSELTLTDVYRGLIFGSVGTVIQLDDGTPTDTAVIRINGMRRSWIERMELSQSSSAGTDKIGLDLDWDGTGSIGLSDNVLHGVGVTNCTDGFRIGHSGNGEGRNKLMGCGSFGTAAMTSIHIKGTTGNTAFLNTGAADGGIGIRVTGTGQLKSITGFSFSGNNTWDISIENATECLIAGGRTESTSAMFFGPGSNIHIAGMNQSNTSGMSLTMDNATVIAESCNLSDVTGTGTLTIRGTGFANGTGGFSGTLIDAN